MEKSSNQPIIKKNTLRFNTSSNVDSQVAYAEKYLLNCRGSDESFILLQGTGVTTSKVVAAVEKIKENFREQYGWDLYQINKIGSIVFDKENRCIKEDDLPEADSSVTDKAVYAGLRRVSCIEVILSIDKIETEDPGYQHDVSSKSYKPKSYKSYKIHFDFTLFTKEEIQPKMEVQL